MFGKDLIQLNLFENFQNNLKIFAKKLKMEIISSIFSPLLTVYASKEANEIALKNGFTSLSQLLEPFLRIRGRLETPTFTVENFTARLNNSKEILAKGIKIKELEKDFLMHSDIQSHLNHFLRVRIVSEHECWNHSIASKGL